METRKLKWKIVSCLKLTRVDFYLRMVLQINAIMIMISHHRVRLVSERALLSMRDYHMLIGREHRVMVVGKTHWISVLIHAHSHLTTVHTRRIVYIEVGVLSIEISHVGRASV